VSLRPHRSSIIFRRMADMEFEQTEADVGPAITLSKEQEEKYEIITRSLQEFTSGEILRKVISEDKTPVGYWGELLVLPRRHMLSKDRFCNYR
jgi:hypothetical protein